MVTVTKQNFLKQSNLLIQKLPSAAYVSIDMEMTGIATPSSSIHQKHKAESVSERYEKIKKIPERYSVIQIGIALFHENPRFRKFVKKKVVETENNEETHLHVYGLANNGDGHGQAYGSRVVIGSGRMVGAVVVVVVVVVAIWGVNKW
mmetsp:Transcript_14027/g.16303  ORF Transcript_14027/g.16303 Transcript_14027/m.16303 type:complete len:148 (-) Transcript_14027:514-957(-)